ncbi:MAG: hypothetical protein HY005_01620 [Candidatus Staskawiczbacteria bacterium]|nr:hypothetical protein [Candidatus Staskawiczbacteria bacterium]MBI3337307.1 hypothetical protein [Candidatus Staskawiczbacteria bacterium]
MFFEEYINYLKDNPDNYWFKRKLYGWGWTPAKWQGWIILIVFIIFIVLNAIAIDSNPEPDADQLTWFFAKTILSVAILIFICYKKGEKPKWQWGMPKKDKN